MLVPLPRAVADGHALVPVAVQQDLARLVAQLADRGAHAEPVALGNRVEDLGEPRLGDHHPPPRDDRTLGQGERLVGHHLLRVDLQPAAEPGAGRARPVRRVEAEVARRRLLEAAAMLGAGVPLAVEPIGPIRSRLRKVDEQRPVGQPQGSLDRVGHAGRIRAQPIGVVLRPAADGQPVDDHLDAVLVLLVEGDLLVELAQLAVDPDPDKPGLLGAGQELLVLALAVADERGQEHEARSLGELIELVDDLLDRLPGDLASADRAVHAPHAREEEAQVVIDLGDRANRGARIPRGPLLVDADRRGEAIDLVDIGLLHLPQELARVGGERLDVAALPLRVDGVEGKAALAASRQPGDHDQAVARHLHVEVLEVVLAGAAHHDSVGGHRFDDIRPMRTPVRFRFASG